MKHHADFHTHSNYSRDSVINPRSFIENCIRKGMTCVAVTDHNEIEGAFVIDKLVREQGSPQSKPVAAPHDETGE